MKNLRNFQGTAEVLFFIVGSMYTIALLFWKNEVFLFQVAWFFEIADLPFLLISLCYFLGSIRLDTEEKYLIETLAPEPPEGTFSFLNLILFLVGGGIFILFFLLDVLLPFLQNPHKNELPFLAFFGL